MNRWFFIATILVFSLLVIFVFSKTTENTQSLQPQRFWEITAVDTVKYSRDPSRDPHILTDIPPLVAEAAKLHVTHIAIDTPYDEEFVPVLTAWVHEARKNNLNVWFRGNFSGWEGWFGYPKFDSINEHNQLTAAFIAKHPDLFANGDIFTPLPEMENGGPGDPRGSDSKTAQFNANLVSSYNNCLAAFKEIHKDVSCGFFSTNGDIAKDILTQDTVSHIGNVVVIDHYVDSPDKMQEEIDALTQKFPGSKIVLGEFGAPIPDINGDMTEEKQNTFVKQLMDVFYANRAHILGLNYWTLAGGSTQLLNDNFSERKIFTTLANYYLPNQLMGKIVDTLGIPLGGIKIINEQGNIIATTNKDGLFSIAGEKNNTVTLIIHENEYNNFEQKFVVAEKQQKLHNIELQPRYTTLLHGVLLFVHKLFLL